MARHFSLEEIEELRRQLVGNSVKDTDMEIASVLRDSDTVAIVQNGKNKRTTVDTIDHHIIDTISKEVVVTYTEQSPTEAQKIQARTNIGAGSKALTIDYGASSTEVDSVLSQYDADPLHTVILIRVEGSVLVPAYMTDIYLGAITVAGVSDGHGFTLTRRVYNKNNKSWYVQVISNVMENTVSFSGQILTEVEKSQARSNIGALSSEAGAVLEANIATGAVTNAKLGANSVTKGKIKDGDITTDKLATGAVTKTKIADGSIEESKIAVNAVTSDKIADGNIIASKLGIKSVLTSALDDGAVTSDKIADGVVPKNIKDSSSTGGLDQLHDGGDTLDFTDKNPKATTYDSTLTGALIKGAVGNYASSFGGKSVASGKRAFAEGTMTIAKGAYSHAEGGDTVTLGAEAHAEGYMTTAVGQASHSEGNNTVAEAIYSHAEGDQTLASGNVSHAEGYLTKATKEYSHAEGMNTVASGATSHTEGDATAASGMDSHAEGYSSTASGDYSHAEGNSTEASGNSSHAEGYLTKATHPYTHAEGMNTTASGDTSHVEGNLSTASGTDSHAEGYSSTASGATAHAEGANTVASGTKAHAEGYKTTARGDHSHSEGAETKALGTASHAEGLSTTAKAVYAHAEGMKTQANGSCSHAEGDSCIASGLDAHAEGYSTTASGDYSHAEGWGSIASGNYSHAEGRYTKTSNTAEHASGRYNKSNTGTRFSIGIGTSDTARKNAFEVMANGDLYIYGVGDYDGTDPANSNSLQSTLQATAGVFLGDTDLQSNITLTNEQVEAYKNPSASCFVILSGTAYRVYLDVFGVDDTGVVVYRCNRNTNFLAGSVIDSCIQTSLEGNTLTLFVGLQTSIEESEIDEICK